MRSNRRIDLVDHLSLRNVQLSTSIQLRVLAEQNLRINPAVLYFLFLLSTEQWMFRLVRFNVVVHINIFWICFCIKKNEEKYIKSVNSATTFNRCASPTPWRTMGNWQQAAIWTIGWWAGAALSTRDFTGASEAGAAGEAFSDTNSSTVISATT